LYVDEYWSRKCPYRLTVKEINEAVRDLLHEILMKEYTIPKKKISTRLLTEPTMSIGQEKSP
jgi:hypothetical protein